MNKPRVEILDSFRCIAITLVSVMLYHYMYRWTYPFNPGNLYPYGNFFGTTFKYGNLGVQFFFIISGFVISYTLENTEGALSFFTNRFIRLFPPMVLCSVVTFFVCSWVDKSLFQDSQRLKDFLPSLTFINPKVWTAVTGKQFDWISLSYWSLWVEVQFYMIAACIYFSNLKKFFNRSILGE
jgi:peptidoglycan/LPS O-acetylase OafA/YrhL